MDPVTILECQKCWLRWVQNDKLGSECPKCRQHSLVPRKPVVVAGFEVEVKAVVLHGAALGLSDTKVRSGLDKLYLYERCPHSYLTWRICPKCNKKT